MPDPFAGAGLVPASEVLDVADGREFALGGMTFRVDRLWRGSPSAISSPQVWRVVRRRCPCGGWFVGSSDGMRCDACGRHGRQGARYVLAVYDDREVPGVGRAPFACAWWLERVR